MHGNICTYVYVMYFMWNYILVLKELIQDKHCNNYNLSPTLQFYVVESSLEVLARHMLFLALLCEPQQRLGLQGQGAL